MKVLFLSDNFPPEVNAPASRTYEHCREWIKQGVEVTVITCFPNFPYGEVFDGYNNKFYQVEYLDGIKVIRVWSFMAENKGFLLRLLDFISFSIASFFVGLFFQADVIVATSPQFFTALSARTLSFFKRTNWVMEVRDLWPEQVLAVSDMKRNLVIRYFELEEKWCYKSASIIIPVTDSFVDHIVEKGGDIKKIRVIKNGVDINFFQHREKKMELIQKHGLVEKKVIGYIGTHGLSQNLMFVLRCIEELNNKDFFFLFVGDGSERKSLIQYAESNKIENVLFLPQIPKEQMPDYLSIIDIGLVPLKKSELFKTVLPSKIFENAAMHIPILIELTVKLVG